MKKISIYIIAGILLTISYACEKQLSEPPKNEKTEVTAILDEATAKIALNGVFNRFANVDVTANITYWASHSVIPGMLAGQLGYGFGQIQYEYNDNTIGYGGWNQCYIGNNAANGVINSVESLPDDKFSGNSKLEILGVSRFLRAYNNFRLLFYFGEWFNINSNFGVLLRDQPSALSNIPKARSTVADSYLAIIDDLDYAIANAPATNPNYYGTKWAAMVVKMRVLICRGSSNDYAEVITLADNIIQNGPYDLEPNVKDIFYSKGLSSNEVILGIKPQPNQEAYFNILSREFTTGASQFWIATQKLKDMLANDPRGSWVVGPPQPYQFYSPDTYYFTKFIQPEAIPTQLSEVSYVLRLTEVYLLKAEAIIRSNGNLEDARTILKTIMEHAGVTDFSAIDGATTSDELLLQNYYETVKSLVGEDGQDWMALLRLPFETVKQIKPTIGQKFQYYFPIPKNEFENNPIFGEQNPGYQNY